MGSTLPVYACVEAALECRKCRGRQSSSLLTYLYACGGVSFVLETGQRGGGGGTRTRAASGLASRDRVSRGRRDYVGGDAKGAEEEVGQAVGAVKPAPDREE